MDGQAIQSAVTGTLAAGGQALSLIRGIAAAVKASGKSEVMSDLIELQLKTIEIVAKYGEATEHNHRLRRRIRKLKQQIGEQGKLELFHNCYWIRVSEDTLDGPFSMNEWDASRRLVRLTNFGPRQFDNLQAMNFHHSPTGEDNNVPVDFLRQHNVTRQLPE
jgi:hypothetical protein